MNKDLFSNADLRRLIIPLVLEQFLTVAVGMVDTMMVSSLGEAPISGVALINMLNTLIFSVFAALTTGGSVVVSQYIGAKSLDNARSSARQLVIVNAIISIVLMAYSLIFTRWTIRLLFGTLQDDVMAAAMTYYRVTALSFPLVAVYSSCAALLRSQNKSILSLYSGLLSNAVNVVGNALFIYVCGWGIGGAAAATVIARGAATALLMYFLTNRSNLVWVTWRGRLQLQWPVVRRILHIGIPSGIEGGVFQLGRLIVISVIASFGTSQIAANAVANSIDYLGCMVGAAVSLAVITVVGQAVGTGDVATVRFYIRKMMKIGCVSHFLWGIVVFALTWPFLNLYSLTDETRHLAWILILIHNGLGLVMWPWSFIFPNALRSTNDVRSTMFFSVISMIIMRVGGSYVLGGINGLGWGAIGVWIAMVLDWILRISGFLWRYHSNAWVKYVKMKD